MRLIQTWSNARLTNMGSFFFFGFSIDSLIIYIIFILISLEFKNETMYKVMEEISLN